MKTISFCIVNLKLAYVNKSNATTDLELDHLDYKMYLSMKQISGQKNLVNIHRMHKEIDKLMTLIKPTRSFLRDLSNTLPKNFGQKFQNPIFFIVIATCTALNHPVKIFSKLLYRKKTVK